MTTESISASAITSKAKRSLLDDFYVYILFRRDGRPFYVGKGRARRFKYHVTAAKNEKSHKAAIIRETIATGELPIVIVKDRLKECEAFAIEIALIKAMGREPNGPLVNCTDGGEGQSGASQETREKISASRRGKPLTEGHRESLSEALKSYPKTQQQIAKIAKANTGKKRTPKQIERLSLGQKGKILSSSHRENLSKSLTGRTLSDEHRANISIAMRKARRRSV